MPIPYITVCVSVPGRGAVGADAVAGGAGGGAGAVLGHAGACHAPPPARRPDVQHRAERAGGIASPVLSEELRNLKL